VYNRLPINGFEVKSPFDEILMRIFHKRRKKPLKVSRIEKAYFSQLMIQGEVDLIKFEGLFAMPINGYNLRVKKQFTNKTFFDWFTPPPKNTKKLSL
jgi:hypothetical protein